MSRPLFGTSYVPQLRPELGDVGGEGAVCLWCMTPLEGQPLTNGFFCSGICATSYMVQDRSKPEADSCAASSQLLGPGPHHRG